MTTVDKNKYKPPEWKRIPDGSTEEWWFTVQRGEEVLEYVSLNKQDNFFFGRMEDCYHVMRHPTTSRYHSIIQHGKKDGENSLFAFDQSTHGTFVNDNRLKTLEFVKLKLGDQVRFGQSSRHFELHFQNPKNVRKRKREEISAPAPIETSNSQPVAQNAPTPKNVVVRNSWGSAFKKSTLAEDNDPNKKVSKAVQVQSKPQESVRKIEDDRPPTKKLKIIENLQKRIQEEGASKFSMFAGKDTVSEQEAYFNQMRGRGFGNRMGF